MSSVHIRLPDNSVKVFDHEPTVLEVATSIGSRLAKATVGGKINGLNEIIDLRARLKDNTQLQIVTEDSIDGREVIRHSAAHVLAEAVQGLWPEVKVTIGPVVDGGFYYDFDSPRPFTPEDLEKIEARMREVLKKDEPIICETLEAQEAIRLFESMNETYKRELIEGFGDPTVTIYKQGKWFDLCKGPHVQRTGQIKAIKVLSLAGSYWRGDETKARLQRVYATAFNSQKELDDHLAKLEEAKNRDHRKLGKELGLFHFSQLSPGAPFFTGKGSVIYNQLQTFVREMYLRFGYQEVITPQIFDVDLFHQSGHYENYRENMYFTEIDQRQFSVKPMNCPGHCVLFGSDHYSYRDLPVRMADFGRLHRYERSGVMHGLTRVRSFCQDDAHIFCSLEQMQTEIRGFMTMLNEIYHKLGMVNYKVFLSTRPEKRMGDDSIWDKAEGALSDALKSMNIPFAINPGDGAFYGPKLDIMFVDALERPWQLGTLQVDFNMPKAFGLKYVGSDNGEHQPVMLHRAVLGSLERFIGIFLEHTGGRLPTWISPEQVRVLNVTEQHRSYSDNLVSTMRQNGMRVHLDARNEKLGFKIREAQLQKVPYMMVIGAKEAETNTVSVRLPNGKSWNNRSFEEFMNAVKGEIAERSLVTPIEGQ